MAPAPEKWIEGIHFPMPRNKLAASARRLRDFYALKTEAPFIQQEFGFFTQERWQQEGHMPRFSDRAQEEQWMMETFGFEESGSFSLGGLGWCEAAFIPEYEQIVLEDRGDYDLAQDHAGRKVLFFKGRRNGFMPEYVDHPVKDMHTWETSVKWRLNPASPERFGDAFAAKMCGAADAARQGKVIVQNLIGGYMYLRSLIGPVELLYMVYDDPALIHDCMQTWLNLADAVVARHQQAVTIDEIFLAEDICFNHGPLISPDMMREFLFPYYQQLIANTRQRQLDRARTLFIQIDTDGNSIPVIDVYRETGMNYMSPFEVAAGCDVVAVGADYPDLLMRGGIDKRILAQGKDAIDREMDRILPVLFKRGGYIPVCDHGVPEEVSFENYCHFRCRVREYA